MAGTYKIHIGGWVLIIFGIISLARNDRNEIVTRIRPLAFSLTPVESEVRPQYRLAVANISTLVLTRLFYRLG